MTAAAGGDERYFEAVRRLPRPTIAQAFSFAAYVSTAHSWYKHLLPLERTTAFHVFLDPEASPNLERDLAQRVGMQPPAHGRAAETSTHRLNHGFWNADACCSQALRFPDGLRVRLAPGEWVAIPKTVLEAGAAEVTALLHPLSTQLLSWFRDAAGGSGLATLEAHVRRIGSGPGAEAPAPLPAELVETLDRIDAYQDEMARAGFPIALPPREIHDAYSRLPGDGPLAALVSEHREVRETRRQLERQCTSAGIEWGGDLRDAFLRARLRQLRALTSAMDRVSALVYGA